jgi:glycosyltransferase involved in cell wall biosynthesis
VTKIVITICTCERPVDLRRSLDSLAALQVEHQVSVVVVENGPNQEGRTVCDAIAPAYRWPLRCVVEKQRGISFARNTAVDAALAGAPDFIVMIDDDEWVDRRWLQELMRVQRMYDADVVSGPVISVFENSPPKWIERGGFFDRPRMVTGSDTGATRTGNILFRASLFTSQARPWFDPEFALTGGEDVFFLENLARDGRRMVWADEALVFETVMPSRMTERWLVRRAFRGGATYSQIRRRLAPFLRTNFSLIAKAVPQLAFGVLFWIAVCANTLHRVRAEMMIAKASGKLYAFLGGRYHEYANIHRSA